MDRIIGEAPESDSDDEVVVTHGKTSTCTNLLGAIVAGEAPESDDEHEDVASVSSISSAASVSSLNVNLKINAKGKKSENIKYNSLLHKKLRERNISLYKNVVEFSHSTVANCNRDLSLANQQLLRSQIQLQEAATSINLVQSQLVQLHSKLISTTSFLPRVNTSVLKVEGK